MSHISHKHITLALSASVVASVAYLILKDTLLYPIRKPKRIDVIPSPRKEVEKLEKEERDRLPYPPDAFPGGRDVESEYGSIRVYEFGPESGRKVLIIHGISTPCISMTKLAHNLVSKGCRVLLLDLFGRGYSDSPCVPHTAALYNEQIHLALSSSPLSASTQPWTTSYSLNIIGYSFGGGVALSFAAKYPKLIRSVVLLAPGGLIRSRHFDFVSRVLFSGYVPKSIVEKIVRGRMGLDGTGKESRESGNDTTTEEIRGNRDPVFESTVIYSKDKDQGGNGEGKEVTIGDVVEWQVQHHKGFVQSFVSSMTHGPVSGIEEEWRVLKEEEIKVCVVTAKGDSVIDGEELKEDILGVVGEGMVVFREMEGGHEFAVGNGAEVGEIVGSSGGCRR